MYFVINGFLFNEKYISEKLTNTKSKTFSEYFRSSIDRIIYSSIVGSLISMIIGLVLNIDKKLAEIINKRKFNIIILKGEISELYKCYNFMIIIFIIIQFIAMTCFVIYILCFCYVYPYNILDWVESSSIIIGIIQLFVILFIFIISFFRYISLRCQFKICFDASFYLYDKID